MRLAALAANATEAPPRGLGVPFLVWAMLSYRLMLTAAHSAFFFGRGLAALATLRFPLQAAESLTQLGDAEMQKRPRVGRFGFSNGVA